jgi:small subunit ribosomal protein S20
LANTKTAKKQLLVTARNHARNQHYGSLLKTALKKARLAIAGGADAQAAAAAVNEAVRTLHRSATKGIIRRENASRRAGRIMRAYNAKYAQPATVQQAG